MILPDWRALNHHLFFCIMYKLIYVFIALFMFSSLNVCAKKKDKTEKIAAKNAKAKRKADKKEAKMRRYIAEYEDFVQTYSPIPRSYNRDANSVITSTNAAFAALNSIYEKVGYVVVETSQREDEITGELTTVIDRVYDRRYPNKTIDINAKKSEYKQCGGEIALLVAASASLSAGVVGIVMNKDSRDAISPYLGTIIRHNKMIIRLVPMIKNKIKKDSEALEFMKNN